MRAGEPPGRPASPQPGQPAPEPDAGRPGGTADSGIDARRRLAGVLLAAGGLPLLTSC